MKRDAVLFAIAIVCCVLALLDCAQEVQAQEERQTSVAILKDSLPNGDERLVPALVAQLQQNGFRVTELSAEQVCDESTLSPRKYFLYVIPQCRTYPAAGLQTLIKFAQHRGHLLFLGGPFLDDPIWRSHDRWLNKQAILDIKRNAQPAHEPFPTASLDTAGWIRTCNDLKNTGAWKVVPEGPQGEKCYRYSTQNLTGWDGYLSPSTADLFGPQQDLFTFLAKGSPRTPQICVEIQERDGSRWMAVAELGSSWRKISLDPSDFKYWPDSSSRNRRGEAGDRLHPQQAIRVNFQLAQSHTTAVPPGKHTFWIANIGTCQNPVADMPLTAEAAAESLESILPRYKVYTLREQMRLQPSARQNILTALEPFAAQDMVCAIPRTMGRGFQREQKWRYLPLLDATDTQGRHRGSPAWMLINHAPPYTGSVFACLGVNDAQQLASRPMLEAVSNIARRLQSSVFLADAGSQHFAYWPEETVTLGARVANSSGIDQPATVRMTVRRADGTQILSETAQLEVTADDSTSWQTESGLPAAAPATYRVVTELLVHDVEVDRIEHDFTVLDTQRPAEDEFVSVQGNNFLVHGRRWYPVGINFWPLYVSGMDHQDFWAGWLQRRYYDPQLVEHDLDRMEALGINMVSIQSNDPQYYRNLLDFVHRCRRHNIYVNLFCGLASPIAFRERQFREYVQQARLADNPTIMAYDTIWEPGNYMFGKDWRPRWDNDWRKWIDEQYGNLEAAERDWEFKAPRDGQGQTVAPPDKYFRVDGPWRTLMAAYRRFMDDLMSRQWNQANRTLREIDPNHLISFRQGNTLPHDFTFTATPKHIDFICPEGYAIPHSEDGYFVAGFITKYVHFTTRGKPIIWSEFGQSVWDAATMDYSARRVEAVCDYHELFYRMALETGANGTVPWWWPGGYRVGERSDFGIVNPDGTPRPAANLLLKYGPQLKASRDWPEPSTWFDMDRDAHAGGYWYVCFNEGCAAYRKSVAAGTHLGIRTAGTGTTSASTPLVAVGNRPGTGSNPPKYLNAEFNSLQILDASGQWIEGHDGAVITVAPGAPVRARASVGNTQEATWLAPRTSELQTGDVVLSTTDAPGLRGTWPLRQDTPYLADADFGEVTLSEGITVPTRVELRMQAHQRGSFGEKRTFSIVPKTQ